MESHYSIKKSYEYMSKSCADWKWIIVYQITFWPTWGQARVSKISHNLGLCIDKLEEIVNKVAKEYGLDWPKLMYKLIFVLLFNVDDMQHLLDVADTFCKISGLTINVDQTKMMAIKTMQQRHYPTFTYNKEPKQVVQSFLYSCINV